MKLKSLIHTFLHLGHKHYITMSVWGSYFEHAADQRLAILNSQRQAQNTERKKHEQERKLKKSGRVPPPKPILNRYWYPSLSNTDKKSKRDEGNEEGEGEEEEEEQYAGKSKSEKRGIKYHEDNKKRTEERNTTYHETVKRYQEMSLSLPSNEELLERINSSSHPQVYFTTINSKSIVTSQSTYMEVEKRTIMLDNRGIDYIDIPDAHLLKATHLKLRNNKLRNLPECTLRMPNLKVIDVSYNPGMCELPEHIIRGGAMGAETIQIINRQ